MDHLKKMNTDTSFSNTVFIFSKGVICTIMF